MGAAGVEVRERKEGRREGGKVGRREGRKEGRKDGRKEGRRGPMSIRRRGIISVKPWFTPGSCIPSKSQGEFLVFIHARNMTGIQDRAWMNFPSSAAS